MKKFWFLLWLASLSVISACTNAEPKSLKEFYEDAKIESIDTIIIQDGSTGASKTISQPEQVDEFLLLTKHVEFTPHDNQEPREGWRYRIFLFDDNQEFEFTLNEINGIYYNSNPEIQPIVEDYYQQVDIAEE